MLYQTILVIHVMIALSLIGLILIQHGKGADAGAAFGSGASGTVFGSQGAASFLTRTTAALATGFFITSLSLGYIVHQGEVPTSVVDSVPAAIESVTPAAPMPEDVAPTTPAAAAPAGPADVPLPE
jgi:preprotein translocase subunit SecG